jgi:hypothetical protein
MQPYQNFLFPKGVVDGEEKPRIAETLPEYPASSSKCDPIPII